MKKLIFVILALAAAYAVMQVLKNRQTETEL